METDEPATLAPHDVLSLCDYIDAIQSKTDSVKREIEKAEIDVNAEDTEQELGERYLTAMAAHTAEELAFRSLQLSNEQHKVIFEEGPSKFRTQLLKLMEEDQKQKNKYVEEHEKLCEEKTHLEELQKEYKRLLEERKAAVERERESEHCEGMALSEETHLKEEMEKLRILNNIMLQLILTSETDWATDVELGGIVEECSKLL